LIGHADELMDNTNHADDVLINIKRHKIGRTLTYPRKYLSGDGASINPKPACSKLNRFNRRALR
jgi:hypothetical protein